MDHFKIHYNLLILKVLDLLEIYCRKLQKYQIQIYFQEFLFLVTKIKQKMRLSELNYIKTLIKYFFNKDLIFKYSIAFIKTYIINF